MTTEQKSQKELIELINQYGYYCSLGNIADREALTKFDRIEEQLSLLYAERERWEKLKNEIHKIKDEEVDDIEFNEGYKEACNYLLKQLIPQLESTQTETKTEGK